MPDYELRFAGDSEPFAIAEVCGANVLLFPEQKDPVFYGEESNRKLEKSGLAVREQRIALARSIIALPELQTIAEAVRYGNFERAAELVIEMDKKASQPKPLEKS